MTTGPGSSEPLSGTAVRLVRFAEGHISQDYLSWLNDRQLMRYSRQRLRVHTRESALEYLDSFARSLNRFWAVERLSDGRLVGTMTAYLDEHHQTADLGILIGTGAAGMGVGREAWGLAAGYCFEVLGLRKLTGGMAAGNGAMVRLCEHWKMVLEARLRAQELLDDGPTDVLVFGLLSSEWVASRTREELG